MGITGGLHHQILYKNNIKFIDEGSKGMEWNPPSFKYNGVEIPEEDYIEIHDNVFRRFHDYFVWIETYNPVGPKEYNRGFNYYGLTAIRDNNLVKLRKLIDSLIGLFRNAPEDIILSGAFCFGFPPNVEAPSDCDPNAGYYEQIHIARDELLKKFGNFRSITERAIKSNGYLLHFGI